MENELNEKSVEELRQLLQVARTKVQEPVDNVCDFVLGKAKEILAKENLSNINVVIKDGVQHSYAHYSKKHIQYGRKSLEGKVNGNNRPKFFFVKYRELFETHSTSFPARYPIVSLILEEISHIIQRHKYGYGKHVKPHGWQFESVMRSMLNEYADDLYNAFIPYEEAMQ